MVKSPVYPFHGGQLRHISERFGIPREELLDFSANINPNGPPPGVIPALRASLDHPSTLSEYPDLSLTGLKQAIARYVQVHEEGILVANGFVPLLEATLRTLNIQKCLLPIPAFVEYRKTLERARVQVTPHTLSAPSFHYDPTTMFTKNCDAVLLANPQNPSGFCHDSGSLYILVKEALRRNVIILLDEAFIDYAPKDSLATAVNEFSNLVVFRSVTKFHGIPGLRVAYAVSNSRLVEAVAHNLPPWPITTMASTAVIAALEDDEYAQRSRSENMCLRTRLQSSLESLGLIAYPSPANFILFKLPGSIDNYKFWEYLILEHHIVVRSCANYEGLSENHFRVAVRTQSDNSKLTHAIESTLARLATGRSCS